MAFVAPARTSLPRGLVLCPASSSSWRSGAPAVVLARRRIQTSASSPSPASSSSPSPSSSSPAGHAQPEAIRKLTEQLAMGSPRFPVRGDEVRILDEPKEFYQALLSLIKNAKRRLVISTLYIGVEQDELISALRTSLASKPNLKLTLLVDYHRSSREPYPTRSTASILYPLVRDFPGRVEAWFYRSPKLSGLMELVVPRRWDEGYGTWHSKIYGGDEEVIISGANLSKDYFSTRQDRYFHFRNSLHLTTYLANLLRLYTAYSYILLPTSSAPHSAPSNLLSLISSKLRRAKTPEAQPWVLHWPNTTIDPRGFHEHAQATLTAFQQSWARRTRNWEGRRVDADTSVWPVLQAGVLGITEEERGMAAVWKAVEGLAEEQARGRHEEETRERPLVDLTSGYFSLYGPYKKAVIKSKADVRIIAAAPKSNGFHGSKGISGLIPEGYTMLESEFEREVQRVGRGWTEPPSTPPQPPPLPAPIPAAAVPALTEDAAPKQGTSQSATAAAAAAEKRRVGHGVELTEWEREGWTYHAKGVWLSPSAKQPPLLTLIGSSNLSTRSATLDHEASFFLTTTSPELRRAMANEVANLRKHAEGHRVGSQTWASPDRKVSWQTKVLVKGLGVGKML